MKRFVPTPALVPLAVGVLSLGACGQADSPMSPPEETVAHAPPAPPPAKVEGLPGTGPTNFVGRWAADVSWCADPQGDRRPIVITTDQFQGYENVCDILAIRQVDGAYEASLRCQGEGMTSEERVRMDVQGDVLNLTYLDRGGSGPVTLSKCTTLAETP